METHDDLEHFPDLPHLLGTDLYTELFDTQSNCVSEDQDSHITGYHDFEDLPFPLDVDADLPPSSYRGVCQHSQLEDHSNPQTIHDFSVLQFGMHPDNFHSFQAMTCPLNTDACPEPMFKCDCGEAFDSLQDIIKHRESDLKHRPWHGVWKSQEPSVCLCGRSFDDEAALRRHFKLAFASIKRQRRDTTAVRRIQRLRKPVVSKPRTVYKPRTRVCDAAKRRSLDEAAELKQHIKEIDMLIVEETMRKLIAEKDGIEKAKRQAKGKISQKQRKQSERERAKSSADHLMEDKVQDGKVQGDKVQDERLQDDKTSEC